MQYETASQMAKRLDVTIRMVQIWAKEGRLPGAVKQGRDWLIPTGLGRPGKGTASVSTSVHTAYPLINGQFETGGCADFIETIEDEVIRQLAWAEYYYFSGQAESAIGCAEPLIAHHDGTVKLNAGFIFAFANVALGNAEQAKKGLDVIQKFASDKDTDSSLQADAVRIFAKAAADVLLHIRVPDDDFSQHIKHLPEGIKIFACYVLAYSAYLQEEHGRALAIIDTALLLSSRVYPIQMIHLRLLSAMSLMSMKKVDLAEKQFRSAWELAQKDGFIEAFAENHGLLCGLVENCMKDEYPEEYEKIIALAARFDGGWHRIHSNMDEKSPTDILTTTEFVIAMLAKRGWSNQEIADFMRMSLHTVKRYISIIFQKLGINNRGGLRAYIHR